jgi:hypothetical protein
MSWVAMSLAEGDWLCKSLNPGTSSPEIFLLTMCSSTALFFIAWKAPEAPTSVSAPQEICYSRVSRGIFSWLLRGVFLDLLDPRLFFTRSKREGAGILIFILFYA